MGSVSIIICTRDRAASLRETLASIGRSTVPPGLAAELVVVDNGSTDATAAAVHDAGLSNLPVRYVFEPVPGQVQARNAGLRATAASDIVLFTDDDVRVPADWLAGMCAPIFEDRADAVTGGVHFPPDYEPLFEKEPFRSRRGWFASTHDFDPAHPHLLVGANMALGRRVVETIGEFDPELGPGALGFCDDSLYAWRLLRAGFRLGSAFGASVEHHFDRSRLTRASLLSLARRMGASQGYVMYHWGGEPALRWPFQVWRTRAMMGWDRLRAPWMGWSDTVSEREMGRMTALGLWSELRRCAGVPRKYAAERARTEPVAGRRIETA